MCTCIHVYLTCKCHAHKNQPHLIQFLHTISAQYTRQVPNMVKNEGLWLSAHGHLPGTLWYYRNHGTRWNPPQQEMLALHLRSPPNQAVAATSTSTSSAMNSYLQRPKTSCQPIPTRAPSAKWALANFEAWRDARTIQHPVDPVPHDSHVYSCPTIQQFPNTHLSRYVLETQSQI